MRKILILSFMMLLSSLHCSYSEESESCPVDEKTLLEVYRLSPDADKVRFDYPNIKDVVVVVKVDDRIATEFYQLKQIPFKWDEFSAFFKKKNHWYFIHKFEEYYKANGDEMIVINITPDTTPNLTSLFSSFDKQFRPH